MSLRRFNLLTWFGILGGPMAWATVHVAGYAFGLAQCDDPASRWQLPVRAWDIGFSAVGVLIALMAEAASLWIFHATRDEGGTGEAPGRSRLHFLSVIGLTVNPLALAIMVMTGVGAPILGFCHQS